MNIRRYLLIFSCGKLSIHTISNPPTLIYSPVWFVCQTKMADSALCLVRSPVNQTPCEGSITSEIEQASSVDVAKPGSWNVTKVFAKSYTHQESQLMTLIILHICFSSEVTFDHASFCEISCLWNYHCEFVTTVSRCMASWPGESSSVCVRRIKQKNCPYVCGLPQF